MQGPHNESGLQFCTGPNGQNLFTAPLGQYYHYQSGGNSTSDDDTQIFTNDNHTHAIHDNYRCSKETNGPILCWEAGGNTNCWNADTWYQVAGNVKDIYQNRNNSSYVTARERSMCDEVYGTGGGNSNNDNPNEYPLYTNDDFPDPNSHDNGGSDLSISNCYLSIYGENDWKHKITKILKPGQSFQINAEGRVRNKSKSFKAKNVDWDWRADGGEKNFDRDDVKLDEDTVDIDPNSKVKKHMGRSTVKLSSDSKTVTITGPKGSKSFPAKDGQCKVCIFIDVEDDYDDDISSRNPSKHEYAVVEVIVKEEVNLAEIFAILFSDNYPVPTFEEPVNEEVDDQDSQKDPEDYCHKTSDTSTSGWGYNPITGKECEIKDESNAHEDEGSENTAEEIRKPTAVTPFNI